MSSKGPGDYWDQIPEQCPRMTAYQRGAVQTTHTHTHTATLSGGFTSMAICVVTLVPQETNARDCACGCMAGLSRACQRGGEKGGEGGGNQTAWKNK